MQNKESEEGWGKTLQDYISIILSPDMNNELSQK